MYFFYFIIFPLILIKIKKFKRLKFKSDKKKFFNKNQYRKYTEEKDKINKENPLNKEHDNNNNTNDTNNNNENTVPPPPKNQFSPEPQISSRPTFPFELLFGTALLVGGIYYFYQRHGKDFENQLEEQKRIEQELNQPTDIIASSNSKQSISQIKESNDNKESLSLIDNPTINEEIENESISTINNEDDKEESNINEEVETSVEPSSNNIEIKPISDEEIIKNKEEEDYKERYYQLLNEYLELKEKTKMSSKDMEALKSIIKQYQDIILTTSSSIDSKKKDEYKEYKIKLIKEYNDKLLNEEIKEKKAIGLFLDNLMSTIQSYEIQRNVINVNEVIDKCNKFESYLKNLEERDHMNNEVSKLILKFLSLQERLNKHPHLPFDKQYNEFKEIANNFSSLNNALLSIPESLVSIGTPSIDVLRLSYKNALKKNLVHLSSENKVKSYIFDYQNYRKERKELYDHQMKHFSLFMKAFNHLEQKDLDKCLEELEKIKDEDKPELLPWIDLANRNIIIQNGLSLLTTEMINLLQYNKQL